MAPNETVEYRDIPGFLGYRAGTDGSIWSCHKHSGGLTDQWHKLTAWPLSRGHMAVTLRRRCLPVRGMVHRLVLETFVGTCPAGMEACHFPDRDPSNNALSNLRWDTPAANALDAEIHGTFPRGSRHGRASLTESDVVEIRRLNAGGISKAALSRRYGVCEATIHYATTGVTWTHVPMTSG